MATFTGGSPTPDARCLTSQERYLIYVIDVFVSDVYLVEHSEAVMDRPASSAPADRDCGLVRKDQGRSCISGQETGDRSASNIGFARITKWLRSA